MFLRSCYAWSQRSSEDVLRWVWIHRGLVIIYICKLAVISDSKMKWYSFVSKVSFCFVVRPAAIFDVTSSHYLITFMCIFPATSRDGLYSASSTCGLSWLQLFRAYQPSSQTLWDCLLTLNQMFKIIKNTIFRCSYLYFELIFCAFWYFSPYFVAFYCGHSQFDRNANQPLKLYYR